MTIKIRKRSRTILVTLILLLYPSEPLSMTFNVNISQVDKSDFHLCVFASGFLLLVFFYMTFLS